MRAWRGAMIGAALALSVGAAAAVEPPPVEAYGALPAVERVGASPSGADIALIKTQGGDRFFEVRDLSGKVKVSLRLGKVRSTGFVWVDDEHVLVFISRTEKFGYTHDNKVDADVFLAVNVKTGKNNLISTRLAQGYAGVASMGGHAYGYSYAVFETNNYGPGSLMRVDLDTGTIALQAIGSSKFDRYWLVAPDTGAIVAESEYNEQSGHWTIYVGAAHRQLVFQSKSLLKSDSLEGQGRHRGTVLLHVLSQDEPRWLEVSLSDGAQTELFKGQLIDEPLFDPVTGLLIGATLDDGARVDLFDPALQGRVDRAMSAREGAATRFVDLTSDATWILTETDGAGNAGTWRLTNGATGASQVVGQSYPAIPADAVGSVRWVDYVAADGLKLRGVLTLPPGPARSGLPVVVMPHGGPIAHDSPGFDWWAQAFASHGYAVWQPNFRGSDGRGQDLVDAGAGEWGRKMQTDISDGLAELAKQGIVDPKRACIVGASYGGYAALAGVTLQHGLYRCAVAVAGVSDLKAFLGYEGDRNGRGGDVMRFWKHLMGASTPSDAALAEISPARQADRADAPILLIHGDDDTTVPISQSREMEEALKRAGKAVEFVELPKEDHHLESEATRQAMLRASVSFVMKLDPSN